MSEQHLSQLQSEVDRLETESRRSRLELLRAELASCSTFVILAETECLSGEKERAVRSLADAELQYATVLRLMSGAPHAQLLDHEEGRELKASMERIRSRLDDLSRMK